MRSGGPDYREPRRSTHRDERNEPHALDAILGAFLPTRLHMRLEGTYEKYVGGDVTVAAAATMVHETMHFFQTALTGYGHIAWDAHRQLTSYLMDEWRTLGRMPDGRRRLPLAHCSSVSPAHTVGAFVANGTTVDWLLLARSKFWIGDAGASLRELGSQLVNQPWAANPRISIAGEGHILQGKEIIEGHAHFVEATFVEAAGIAAEDAWSREGLPKKYWAALAWFVEQCGEARRSMFPFVCDLAQQTSWDPVLPGTEAEWQASNPSWRFVHLTRALRELPHLTLENPSGLAAHYADFSATLLEASGFKPLDAIVAERISALQRRPKMMALERLMFAGMRLRQEIPWCGGNPAADTALWERLLAALPPPLVQIGDRTGGGLGPERDTTELTMELHYQALAAQVLGDFSDRAMGEAAIECGFAKYDIEGGCEFQRSHACTGRYQPADGPPHPMEIDQRGNLRGCSFEAFLVTTGTRSADLDVDHFARMPTIDDLERLDAGSRE